MSKDEKDYVLVGLGDTKRLVVQKSRPLLDIVRIGMSIEELKLLDTYLARINSHEPENTTVVFQKREYEKMLGVKRIRKEKLDKCFDALMQHVITLEKNINDAEDETIKFTLFQSAKIKINKQTNTGEISLTCSDLAKKYIFNIDSMGYINYNLENIAKLNSRYSYILFLYLKDNLGSDLCKKTWSVKLDKLKFKLGCSNTLYNEYRYFNRNILNLCKKEIEEKTAIRFTSEPVKNGRSVVAIKFTAIDTKRLKEAKNKTEKIIDIKPGEISQAEPVKALPAAHAEVNEEKDWDKIYGSSRLAELAEECDYEFTKAEMMLISTLLSKIYIPKSELDKNTNRYGRKDYLREKYLYLCAEAERKKKNGYDIMDRFAYLRAMLESDAEDNPKR